MSTNFNSITEALRWIYPSPTKESLIHQSILDCMSKQLSFDWWDKPKDKVK